MLYVPGKAWAYRPAAAAGAWPAQRRHAPVSKFAGVRLDACVTLFDAGKGNASPLPLGETTGNLIFTQWGFNGPAVMDLSHLAARRPGQNSACS